MRTMELMANAAKGLMLAAFMAVGTTTVNAQENSEETTYKPVTVGNWVKGEEVTGNGQKMYIYNVGAGTFISGKSATETDITKALVWTIGGNSNYTFTSGNYKLYMAYSFGWITDISSLFTTNFTLTDNTTSNNSTSYKLSNSAKVWGKTQTRYFNVDGNKYTAAESKSAYNDWLFISLAQKDAYVEYTKSFNDLDGYLKNEKVVKETTLLDKIKEVLAQVSSANHSFDTYEGDKVTLANIIKEVEDFLNTTTGIETIKPANGNAETAAIYDVNGVRQNSLSKGINIVKMSDGTVKKVIKK
ncbi:MAG TPA: hypothetical protein PLP97_05440 [Prevotella sp.]|nr:hypothetical protein [Prevotella sp.]